MVSPRRTFRLMPAILLCASATAQHIAVHADEARLSTRVSFLAGFTRRAEVRIEYGTSPWRPAHEAEVKAKKPQLFRLGTGFWTTLDAGIELTAGEKKIPASLWYLGLQRLGEGRFGLALLHPTKVRPLGATAGSTATLKPDLVVPLQLEHNPTAHPELRITLRPDSKKPNGIVLAVCWGSHRLSVALEATLALDKTVDPAFRMPLERELTTTASGLKYRELEPGVGPLPAAGSRFTTNYTLWLTSGKKIDTSIGRGPFQFKDGVIPGWLEGIKLMKPGAKFLFVIPPELAYGDRHTGPIPAGSTLVFWVHLLRVDPK